MILRLTVSSPTADFAAHVDSHDFDESGGTIGRSSQSDWVLPDPSKCIGRMHAEIGFVDGHFSITDLSTNGVFLNGSDASLGNGRSSALRNGDNIRIGQFLIAAQIDEDDRVPWPDRDGHGEGELRLPDDFLGSWGGTIAEPPIDLHVSVEDTGGPLHPEPPEIADGGTGPNHADDGDSPATNPTIPWDLGFDHPGGPASLPPDWAPDALGSEPIPATPLKPAHSPEHSAPPRPSAAALAPGPAKPHTADSATARTTGPLEAAARPAEPPPYPSYAPPHPEHRGEYGPAVPPGRPVPVAASGPAPSVPRPSPEGLEAALALVLDGAGLADLRIPGAATPELLRTLGRLIRIYAEGSAELLQTISVIKDTYRIHQTQIRARDNNPLRWVPPDQAVRRLLAPAEDGYLGPTAAAADAIASIKGHQIGAIKGMEAAFKSFVRDLDPQELIKGFASHGSPGLLVNRNAWYWDQYARFYRNLTESARENYLDLLDKAFSDTYEQQVRDIRGAASKVRSPT